MTVSPDFSGRLGSHCVGERDTTEMIPLWSDVPIGGMV